MRNQKKQGLLKGFAIAMGAMLAVAAPAAALGNVFAGSDSRSGQTARSAVDYELVDRMQDARHTNRYSWSHLYKWFITDSRHYIES